MNVFKIITPILIIIFSSTVFITTLVEAVGVPPDSEVPRVEFPSFPDNESSKDLAPPEPATPKTKTNERGTPGTFFDSTYPRRLIIPELDINAPVQQVGIDEEGNMKNPSNFYEVGWYKHGVVPGQIGSAVIAGHLDNGLGLSAVFKDLHTIQIGDEISVINAGGQRQRFAVVDIKSYPYDQVPTDILFDQDDAARLNLITCIGDWVPKDQTYDMRLVVFAVLLGY